MVETARDGFDVQIIRRVIPADGTSTRELNLKTTYQPAHTVTLVGSAGKPAGASIDEAIQKVLDAQKPAEAQPSPTPGVAANATNPPAQATAVPAQQTAPTPTPARNQAPTPKPTPKPN
jgi:hypothetical protein